MLSASLVVACQLVPSRVCRIDGALEKLAYNIVAELEATVLVAERYCRQ